MQDENQSKLLKFSLANKKIAVAVLGQAILDEGGIGASGISIFYTYKEEALHLWKIADARQVLAQASSLSKTRPMAIVTDGLRAYEDAISRVLHDENSENTTRQNPEHQRQIE